jgi:hypothetical protein
MLEAGRIAPVCTEGAGLIVLIEQPRSERLTRTFGPDRGDTPRL